MTTSPGLFRHADPGGVAVTPLAAAEETCRTRRWPYSSPKERKFSAANEFPLKYVTNLAFGPDERVLYEIGRAHV